MLATAEAYFNAAFAAERLRLLQRQQQAVDKAAAEARDRFRIGDRPVIDVHEASARAAALQAERLAAETQLQLARNALADLTGLPADESALPLPGDLRVEDLGTLPEWLARAERRNPALRLAEAQWQTAKAQARASGAAFSPTVDVVAQLARERLSGDGDFGSASNTSRHGAIGVQLAVPLYTGGLRSAQSAESRALVDKAAAELARARQQVAQHTRAAWLDLAVGRSQTAALAGELDDTALQQANAQLR
jgi:outer membrane protein